MITWIISSMDLMMPSMMMDSVITELMAQGRIEVLEMVMKLLGTMILLEMVVLPGVMMQQGTLPGISTHVMKVMK